MGTKTQETERYTMACDVMSDPALIEAVMQHWPNMRPYADTARIEQLYDAQRDEWRMAVTVTVFVI